MLTCSKTYPDIPLAHRQHQHDGHCRFVHGHSWSIRLTFAATQLDAHGFVVDFGKLKYLQAWIDEHLDHAIMLAEDDDAGRAMVDHQPELFKPFWVEHASCEGLTHAVRDAFVELVKQHEGDRVTITAVEVWEDPRNMTRYEAN